MTPSRPSTTWAGHVAMLAFSALIAGSFSLGVLVAPMADPAALSAVRFVLAAGVIGAAALATTPVRRSDLSAPWRYLVLGLLLSIYFVLMFEGLKTADPVSAAAVLTLTPAMAAGFGRLLLRQHLSGRIAAALAIGALGALWVIFRGDPQAALRFEIGPGEAIYFLGCVAHAAYTPMVRRLNRGEPALTFTFGTLLAGSGVLLLWGLAAIRQTDWTALPALFWFVMGYLVICATAMSFVLLQFASLRLPASKVMAYTYLVPSWVILWQMALGAAHPPMTVIVGVCLTAIALFMLLENGRESPTA